MPSAQKLSALDRARLEHVFQSIENLSMNRGEPQRTDIYALVKCGLDIVWNNKKDNSCAGTYNRYFGGEHVAKPTRKG